MDDITPASVMIGFWRWFWVAVLGCALLGGVIVGLWLSFTAHGFSLRVVGGNARAARSADCHER